MPVFNEESTVSLVLDRVREYFSGDIVIIDDGSTDSTPVVLAGRADVAVVRLDRNCGYGCALRIGFDVARELGVTRLITMDCDGQHEPDHIPQFFDALSDADIVSGSRYLPTSEALGIVAPQDRQQVNQRITDEINSVTGWSLTDSFCGFKAYRGESLSRLKLTVPGYAMPIELWAQAWKAGLRIMEMPIERIYCDRDRSFGPALDDPDERLAYYLDVWHQALAEE